MMTSCPLCFSIRTDGYFERKDRTFGVRVYLCCRDCELVFLRPDLRLSKEEEKSFYEKHENGLDNTGYVQHLMKIVVPLKLVLKQFPNASGIDFGCGPGPTLSRILKKEGFEVDDFDPFFESDFVPKKGRYRFLVSTEVVEHFRNPMDEFQKMDSLVVDGGIIALMTGIRYPDIDFTEWWYHRDPTHICFYSPSTLHWIGKRMGWGLRFPDRNLVFFMRGVGEAS